MSTLLLLLIVRLLRLLLLVGRWRRLSRQPWPVTREDNRPYIPKAVDRFVVHALLVSRDFFYQPLSCVASLAFGFPMCRSLHFQLRARVHAPQRIAFQITYSSANETRCHERKEECAVSARGCYKGDRGRLTQWNYVDTVYIYVYNLIRAGYIKFIMFNCLLRQSINFCPHVIKYQSF